MAMPNNYKPNPAMSMPSPQSNPHYMVAGPPMTYGMVKGGMNAPHHNQQYQYGYGSPAPGQYWGQHVTPAARFGAEGGRRAAAGAAGAGGGKDDKTSPFVTTLHSHPAFQPQKIGKLPAGGAGLPKPPKPPEKPLMPYMRYSRRVWDSVKAEHPDLKLWEIGRIIGGMWRDLPETEKAVFVDEYEAEKAQYTEMLKTYQASPAYVQWLAYKSRVGNLEEETTNKKGSAQKEQQQDRRIDIQPAEDEEDQDDGLSVKHIAYARYLRNHRLVNEIFSDTAVPDVRSVVTTARMHILKKQVQSLTMHQKKLEDELQQIEEKFDAKKRKFVESSDAFQEELKKHCKPAVDEETFNRMVERAVEQMRRGLAPAPLVPPTTLPKAEPMETEPLKLAGSGPAPPTQVDAVSTSEVKPEGPATELRGGEAPGGEGGPAKELKPAPPVTAAAPAPAPAAAPAAAPPAAPLPPPPTDPAAHPPPMMMPPTPGAPGLPPPPHAGPPPPGAPGAPAAGYPPAPYGARYYGGYGAGFPPAAPYQYYPPAPEHYAPPPAADKPAEEPPEKKEAE
ncbi:SWI/SNF-related matrix-associated actin-dependent regulator of chromatin subfamily E member 1 isoform X2 [Plutella xylostella]|uniref:SWI/SNF-related matrix-associated actin-dependent regulator of chromatin subfamily E member 1 isoform X2 n=1 Tax=Plutella xylostella TaxID=51655 RepID=UPI0020322A29|nr:SWI/SNF-related matrix-associated actin-dependent regulator of chromatin subfamily E member 1 isoform X2 [Plutella xylostella]